MESGSGHSEADRPVFFGLWTAFGWTDDVANGAARFPFAGTEYFLFSGEVAAVQESLRPPWWSAPNVWCPPGLAWMLNGGLDLTSTYVGGSVALARDLLGSRRLEAQMLPRRPTLRTMNSWTRVRPGALAGWIHRRAGAWVLVLLAGAASLVLGLRTEGAMTPHEPTGRKQARRRMPSWWSFSTADGS